jgi:hypothetical protein
MREKLHFEVAVLVSLLLHVLLLGGAEYRDKVPLLRKLKPAATPVSTATAVAKAPVEPVITFVEQTEPPPVPVKRTFMETDPSQVTGEKPKEAEHYSDRSTVAANPQNPTGKTGDTPYLDGTGTKVMSTADVLPGKAPTPAVPPTPPPPPAAPPTAPKLPATETKPAAEAGLKVVQEPPKQVASLTKPTALTMTKPVPPTVAPPSPGSPGMGSAREIAARKSQLNTSGTAKIGVAAFNVAESPFGAYDKIVVRAVQSRWYALIEQNGLYERAGQVTLRFQLLDDGTVQAMEVRENTAGQVLALFCEKAVTESAPFAPLPGELRVLIGKEPREVNFTFYY